MLAVLSGSSGSESIRFRGYIGESDRGRERDSQRQRCQRVASACRTVGGGDGGQRRPPLPDFAPLIFALGASVI